MPQINLMEVIHQEQCYGEVKTWNLLTTSYNIYTASRVRCETCILVSGSSVRVCACVQPLPGCGALYRSSCRKGSELTRSGALDGWKNSIATKSPDVLLSWKSRGVKLNLPGSEKQENQTVNPKLLLISISVKQISGTSTKY